MAEIPNADLDFVPGWGVLIPVKSNIGTYTKLLAEPD